MSRSTPLTESLNTDERRSAIRPRDPRIQPMLLRSPANDDQPNADDENHTTTQSERFRSSNLPALNSDQLRSGILVRQGCSAVISTGNQQYDKPERPHQMRNGSHNVQWLLPNLPITPGQLSITPHLPSCAVQHLPAASQSIGPTKNALPTK